MTNFLTKVRNIQTSKNEIFKLYVIHYLPLLESTWGRSLAKHLSRGLMKLFY